MSDSTFTQHCMLSFVAGSVNERKLDKHTYEYCIMPEGIEKSYDATVLRKSHLEHILQTSL